MSQRDDADEILIAALATGRTVVGAGRQAGVSESTVRRRMADPEFARRVSDFRGQIVSGVVGRLLDLMGKAMDRLEVLVDDKDGKLALGAVREIFASGFKGHQLVDLQERLERIESRLGGAGNAHSGEREAAGADGGPAGGADEPGPGPAEGGPGERVHDGGGNGGGCVAVKPPPFAI